MNKTLVPVTALLGVFFTFVPKAHAETCTAAAIGPTFWFDGRAYFHFETTCDTEVATIRIEGSVTHPDGYVGTRSKTCNNAKTCTLIVASRTSIERGGTYAWTNETTYACGSSSATNTWKAPD